MPPTSTDFVQRASSAFPTWITVGILVAIIGVWSNVVNKTVPEPYLVSDNVFAVDTHDHTEHQPG